ncbi:MAG TPA: hypothetical protein VGZ00_12105 [Candidatus Baltobacteraceae bacterium]|jgi:hypothetical protein|nr:hypothetical protein [Candidatus Baltobacteraceae bacterium]
MASTSVPPPNPHSIPYGVQVAQTDTEQPKQAPLAAQIIRFSFQSNRADANDDPAALTVVRWDSDGQGAGFQRFYCLPNGQARIHSVEADLAIVENVDQAHPHPLSRKLVDSRVVVNLYVAMDGSLVSRLPEIVRAWNHSHGNGATSLKTSAHPQDPDRIDIEFLKQLVGAAWGSEAIAQVEAAVKNPPRQQTKSDTPRKVPFK